MVFSEFTLSYEQLYHPYIYSEYGTKEITGVKVLNTRFSDIRRTNYRDNVSIPTPYLIGGASLSLFNVYFSQTGLTKLIYVTNFLSMKNITIDIGTYEDYDPLHNVITFRPVDDDYYLSIAGLLTECNITVTLINASNYSWDYLLDIDTRKINVSNMCGINYDYASYPIKDINKYGLDYSSYSFYNFSSTESVIWKDLNMSETNTEYLRGYVIQMIRPLAKRFELLELIDNVSKLSEDMSEYNNITDSVIGMNETLTDVVTDVETMNETLTDVVSDVETINETLTEMVSDVETMNESLTDVVNNVKTMNETLVGVSSNVEIMNNSLTDVSSDVETINETLVGVSSDVETMNDSLTGVVSDVENISSDIIDINNSISALSSSVSNDINILSNNISNLSNIVNVYIVTAYNALKQKIGSSCDNCSIFDLINEINSTCSSSSSSSSSSSTSYIIAISVLAIISVILITVLVMYCCFTKKVKNHQTYSEIN